MNNRKSIIWFRNNLRLSDNQALFEAVTNSEEVLFLYILDKRHWKETPIGLSASSDRKLTFLWDSLMDLKKQLQEIDSHLTIIKGDADTIIDELVEQYGINTLYTTKEAGFYEEKDLEKVELSLMKKGVATYSFAQSTLFHPEDIPWPINKLPQVFTQFRKENEKQTDIRNCFPGPRKAVISLGEIADYKPEDFGITLSYPTSRAAFIFKGGEKQAVKRLNHYFWDTDCIQQYKQTRNGLLGEDYSSKFSAYLALGCISPRTIYDELKRYENERKSNQSTYWLYFELIWRDYFHFILKQHGVKLFSEQGIKEEDYQWNKDAESFEKWCRGKTGVPFIDANMIELNETGFMSNRGRQLVASFLTHDLNIDWRWGAWYFERQLIDYDVASNWGNWAYVAGVGNDPRENRYFNILSQAKRYDGQGEYIRHWLPELKDIKGFNIHKIGLLEEEILPLKTEIDPIYKRPMVNMKKWEY